MNKWFVDITKVKPCPFCGGSPDYEQHINGQELQGYSISCPYCHITTEIFETFDEVLEIWNRRVEGENEALKNEIAHLKLVISRFQTGGEG